MFNSPIRDIDDLSRIFIIALESGYKLHNDEGIMIGYDFDCDSTSGCKGIFRSMDGSIELNNIVVKFLANQSKTFEPLVGNQALVISEGTIKDVKIASMKSTAAVCTTEEFDAKKIKCGFTFSDMKSFGLDKAICIENSCVDKGVEV